MDCLFCKIVEKNLAAQVIYEDDKYLVFLDINPVTKGHSLAIPKKHANNFTELSDEDAKGLAELVHKVAPQIVRELGASGYNLGINNGAAAGQIIEHFHWHIIPRYDNDQLELWSRNEYEAEILDQTFDTLKGKIK